MLLSVMFLTMLMVVGLMLEAPRIAQQIQREKELELIHRGNEYKSAIKKYFRKFGQYPVSVDQLVNTNNMRFLRKRYKDPITGNDDWRIWHVGEVQMNLTTGAAQGAGQATGGTAFGQSPGGSAFGQSPGGSAFGQSPGGGAFGQSPGGSAFGQSPGGSAFRQSPGGSAFGQSPGFGASTGGGSTTTPSSPDQSGAGAAPNDSSSSGITPAANMPGASNSPVIGGGPIMGVSSISKKKSIIEVKGKNHYNEWPPFYYDPRQDVASQMPIGAGTPGGNPTGSFNTGPGMNQPGTGFGQSGMGFGPPAAGQQGPGGVGPTPNNPPTPPAGPN